MFTYCPHCRGKFQQKQKMLLCSDCAFEWYPNPKPANAAILTNKKNQLLLGKRKRDPGKNKWDLIGGFIDALESAEESMQREAEEEIKTNINDLRYVGSYYDFYDYQDKRYNVVILIFSGRVDEERIEAHDDIAEYRFFEWEDIPYGDLAFENMKIFLKKYASAQYEK